MRKLYRICWIIYSTVFLYASPIRAQWSTATIAHKPSNPMVTSAGGKAFFAGGGVAPTGPGNTTQTDLVSIYDGVTNQWASSKLSKPTVIGTAVGVDGKAIFAGGSSYSQWYLDKVEIYNTSTGQWSATTLSKPRVYLASTSVGSKAIFAGGLGNDGPIVNGLDVVDIYDATTGNWKTAQLSQRRYSIAATSVGNKAIFAGGQIYYDNVDIYNVDTDSWTTSRLSEARGQIAATSVGNKAFFAGGSNPGLTPPSSTIDIYDVITNQWSTAKLSQGRSGVAAASLGNLAFFAGGTDASGNASSVIDIYNATTNQWSSTQLPNVKGSLVAVSVNNKILFLENGSGKVDIYTMDNALPVKLVSFTGIWVDNIGAKLNWRTSAEIQNDYYEIQRSSDAKSFETIGRVRGQGTSNTPADYNFTDTGMPGGISYYRLKQVDFDRSAYFSTIISINSFDQRPLFATLTVWPIPAKDLLTMQVSEGQSISEITISDINSRKVLSQTGPSTSADVSALQSGTYIVDVLTKEGQHLRSRFVRQ